MSLLRGLTTKTTKSVRPKSQVSMASGAMDIHVLEESVSRVTTLSKDIKKNLKQLNVTARRAQQSLSPMNDNSGRRGLYRANVDQTLEAISELNSHALAIEELKGPIGSKANAQNLGEYSKSLDGLNSILTELLKSDYRQFYRLIDDAQQLQQQGNKTVEEVLAKCIRKCFPLLESAEYMDAMRPFPAVTDNAAADLRALFALYESRGRGKDADKVLEQYLVNYLNHALAEPARMVQNSTEGSTKLKVYIIFIRKLQESTQAGLDNIFATDPPRLDYFTRLVESTCNAEHTKVSKGVTDSAVQNAKSNDYSIFDAIESTSLLATTDAQDLDQLKSTGFTKLRQVLQQTEQKAKTASIPSEASVCGATVNVLTMLRNLAKFPAGIRTVLAEQAPRAWLPSPAPDWASKTSPSTVPMIEPISLYFSDCVEALVYGLLGQARQSGFHKPSQQGIFLMFNLAHIEHSINTTTISNVMGPHGSGVLLRLNKQATDLFLDDWKKLATNLMDVTSSNKSGKLSSKDREIVKEKFRVFNSEFESLIDRQRRYNVTDAVLRKKIAREIESVVKPLYYRFYDKHSGGDFTKNLDKYIKYDKIKFDATISSLV